MRASRFLRERPARSLELPSTTVRRASRRDVLLFGAGVATTAVGAGSLLPPSTLGRLGVASTSKDRAKREWLLDGALRLDDDIAEALYSRDRMVPTYDKTQITPLKNNYNGATPDPGYIPEWRLVLDGLSSGVIVSLGIRNLLRDFTVHDQITRLVCVEGWSAVSWWSGIRLGDLVHTYPPASQARWARVESSVNLDSAGVRDPYFVSLDLATACHRQTLLATHLDGAPLTVEHGAPMRLLAPMKLGLKNVKAITNISYVAEQPADYWASRGYSRYDGI
jgi:DMSO/TMAO reductase YedYZ molybdopterin-dependent catalytic subunit